MVKVGYVAKQHGGSCLGSSKSAPVGHSNDMTINAFAIFVVSLHEIALHLQVLNCWSPFSSSQITPLHSLRKQALYYSCSNRVFTCSWVGNWPHFICPTLSCLDSCVCLKSQIRVWETFKVYLPTGCT